MTFALVVVALGCVGLPAAGLWLVSESTGTREGDDVARDRIRLAAASLEEDLGYLSRARNAETIAAGISKREEGAGTAPEGDWLRIEAVAWSGRATGSRPATIDVRFTAIVGQRHAVSFGDRGSTAGSATMCYRYLLQLYRYATREEIDCPDIADPPIPVAEVIPALPDDARQRLEKALRTATSNSLAADVRAAFPDEFITVDTARHGGELVAAVGVPAERECLLATRRVDGTIDYPGYDRIWLEPGELGCRVALYTAPPR
jgi:hypothetical protein